jgi:hypothetical protein
MINRSEFVVKTGPSLFLHPHSLKAIMALAIFMGLKPWKARGNFEERPERFP